MMIFRTLALFILVSNLLSPCYAMNDERFLREEADIFSRRKARQDEVKEKAMETIKNKLKKTIFESPADITFSSLSKELRFVVYSNLSTLADIIPVMHSCKWGYSEIQKDFEKLFPIFKVIPFPYFADNISTIMMSKVSIFVNLIAIFPTQIIVHEEGPLGSSYMFGDERLDTFDVLQHYAKDWYRPLLYEELKLGAQDSGREDENYMYSSKVPPVLIGETKWEIQKFTEKSSAIPGWDSFPYQEHIVIFPLQDRKFHAKLYLPQSKEAIDIKGK